ncbi:hypothetical protein BaRGS_00026118 [Batillaria attramentaria]|uniref:3'-5' exonuclease domain-containing protein n=1 Tax=Batillaria attramentaria TaxID=370345 RepID=A0ABD0K5S1_9CAEN
MGKIHLVVCSSGAEGAVQRIMLGEPVIGLASTGVNVGPKGKLSLILLTTGEGDVYAFDVKKYPDLMYQGLGRLLQSVHVLKVVHNSAPLAANLHFQFGISLQNIFDTQVAYSIIMENMGLCGRRVPLAALCEKCSIEQYAPSPQFQKLLAEDMNAWARRPLTKEMLNTAASLVLPLVPSLYGKLMRAIDEKSWEWFQVLNEENRVSLIRNKRASAQQSSRREATPRTSHQELPVFRLSKSQRELLKDTLPPAART